MRVIPGEVIADPVSGEDSGYRALGWGGWSQPPPLLINAAIGDTLGVILQGDGVNGAVVGTFAGVGDNLVRLVLTSPVGPIPASTILNILTNQIAAFGRIV